MAEGTRNDDYEWQRTAKTAGTGKALEISDLPDLPDLDVDEDDNQEAGVRAKVQVRELTLPELGLDSDLVPPGPNAMSQNPLGLLEWTGIWVIFILFLGVLALASADLKLAMSPQDAAQLQSVLKPVFLVVQVLFLSRIILDSVGKVNKTQMPFALCYYPTEPFLVPVRSIFKPEAGVDIAPIIWLMLVSLAAELITGLNGILPTLMENGARGLGPGRIR